MRKIKETVRVKRKKGMPDNRKRKKRRTFYAGSKLGCCKFVRTGNAA